MVASFKSMNQPQFDLTEGQRRKDEGMATVDLHTPDEWKAKFRAIARSIAYGGQSFAAEDVLFHIGPPPGSQNAIGAAMNALARELKLTCVGYRKSKRPSRHAAIVTVWKLP